MEYFVRSLSQEWTPDEMSCIITDFFQNPVFYFIMEFGTWWMGVCCLNSYDEGIPLFSPHHTSVRPAAVSPAVHKPCSMMRQGPWFWPDQRIMVLQDRTIPGGFRQQRITVIQGLFGWIPCMQWVIRQLPWLAGSRQWLHHFSGNGAHRGAYQSPMLQIEEIILKAHPLRPQLRAQFTILRAAVFQI